MSVALPENSAASAQVLSFSAARDPLAKARHQESLDRLDAQVEAGKRFVDALEKLSDYRHTAPSEAEIMNALDRALTCVVDAVCANDGAVLIMDESSGDLVFALVRGEVPKKKLLWQRVPAGRGIAQWVAVHRRAAIVNSTLNDERFYQGIDAASGYHTRSIVAVPLIDGGEVLGVIEVLNKKNEEFFSLSDQNHLTVMAHLASALLRQVRDRQAEKLIEK